MHQDPQQTSSSQESVDTVLCDTVKRLKLVRDGERRTHVYQTKKHRDAKVKWLNDLDALINMAYDSLPEDQKAKPLDEYIEPVFNDDDPLGI
jgi:hypothetical protein